MTSNGKQFTVTREMLTAVANDQGMQLKVATKISPASNLGRYWHFIRRLYQDLNSSS